MQKLISWEIIWQVLVVMMGLFGSVLMFRASRPSVLFMTEMPRISILVLLESEKKEHFVIYFSPESDATSSPQTETDSY